MEKKKNKNTEVAEELNNENIIEDSYTKPDSEHKDDFLDLDDIPENLESLELEPPLLDLDFDEPSDDDLKMAEIEDVEKLEEVVASMDTISLVDPV